MKTPRPLPLLATLEQQEDILARLTLQAEQRDEIPYGIWISGQRVRAVMRECGIPWDHDEFLASVPHIFIIGGDPYMPLSRVQTYVLFHLRDLRNGESSWDPPGAKR